MRIIPGLARRAAAALGTGLLAAACLAGAPQQGQQAPGWYRMTLGDFEVTALSDGTVDLPVDKLLTNTRPQQVARLLGDARLKPPVETSVNGYLIHTGDKLVLIDAGAGVFFGPTLGKLVANLKASGYQPDQVDEIYVTHLHADHVGGIVADGRAVFANAVLRVEQQDVDFWLSAANLEKAKPDDKGVFQAAAAALKPYADAGRLKPYAGDTALLPGIRAQVTRGHTPGHSVFRIESKGQRMIVFGDLLHVAAVQFPHPEVTMAFDSDSKTAAPQRRRLFAAAARSGDILAIAHVSFPGLGQVRGDGKTGYRWQPLNYQRMR